MIVLITSLLIAIASTVLAVINFLEYDRSGHTWVKRYYLTSGIVWVLTTIIVALLYVLYTVL